jgi:exonuclease VII large subunit
MKKWIAAAAAAALASSLYAAPTAGPSEDAMKARQEMMLKRIQAQLGLSDQQTKQWGEIQERYMKAHLKLRAQQNDEINAMLTKEQQKKFELMQQRFRERLNQRMSGGK